MPWCVIDMRNASPLKKTWFHSPSRYQLQVASWVRGGKSCLFPFLPAGILAGLSLYLSCTCCHSLCKFICSSILSCLDYTLSLESFITSKVYNHSISSTWIPEPWGKLCDIEISFVAENLKVSHSLHTVQLWRSHFLHTLLILNFSVFLIPFQETSGKKRGPSSRTVRKTQCVNLPGDSMVF